MHNRTITHGMYVMIVVASLFLVILGHIFVLQRTVDGPTTYLTVRGDTMKYVSMIQGDYTTPPSPFKYRVLVPLVASILPFSPLDSLRIISYGSLFLSYIVILLTCHRMEMNVGVSVAGLYTAFCVGSHLYYYHNPFLSDAAGLFVLCLLLFFFVSKSFWPFLLTAVVGVLARESTFFLAPMWTLRRFVRGLALLGAAMLVFSIPRYILPSGQSSVSMVLAAIQSHSNLHDVYIIFSEMLMSYGVVWLIAGVGLLLLPSDRFEPMGIALALLTAGAFLLATIVTDISRMFSIVFPVVAICSAQLYVLLVQSRRGIIMISILFGILLVHALSAIPNVVFGEGSIVFTSGTPQKVRLAVGMIFTLWVVVAHRDRLRSEVRQKAVEIGKAVRSAFQRQ